MEAFLPFSGIISAFGNSKLQHATSIGGFNDAQYASNNSTARAIKYTINIPSVDYKFACLIVCDFAMRAGSAVNGGVGYETNLSVPCGVMIAPFGSKITRGSSVPFAFIHGPLFYTSGASASASAPYPIYLSARGNIISSDYIEFTASHVEFYVASRQHVSSTTNQAVTNIEMGAGLLFLFA